MNLVDVIRNQVSSEQVNQLASLLGTSNETIRTAVNAAVPSLLGAITQMVSSGGVAKVINALLRFSPGSADLRSTGNSTDQVRQGDDVLTSMFGPGVVQSMAGALSKFGNVGPDGMRKLLGYLTPVVLSGTAAQATSGGRRLDSQSVTSFFNEQRANVENAMPMGLSMTELLGSSESTKPRSEASMARWFVPVAAVAAVAVGSVLYFNRNSPTLNVPANANEMRTSVVDACKTMTTQLDKIQDVDSAQAAVPELRKLASRFATLKTAADKMPTEELSKVRESIENNVAKVDEQFAKLTWKPGVREKLQPVVEDVLEKMSAMCGTKPDTRMSTVSTDLAQTFSSFTQTMNKIKDPATATEALPQLKDVEAKLDQAKQSMQRLSESSREKLATIVKPEMAELRQTIEKMLAQQGVGEKVKPTIDSILSKINSMIG